MVIACDRYEPPDLVSPHPGSESGLVKPVVDHARDVNFRPAYKDSTDPRNRTEIGRGPSRYRELQPIDLDDKVPKETAASISLPLGLERATHKTSRS